MSMRTGLSRRLADDGAGRRWYRDPLHGITVRPGMREIASRAFPQRACLAAMVRVSVKNDRRAEAERNAALAATEPDVE